MSVQHFSPQQAKDWYQSGSSRLFLADVIDASNSSSMSAGFARYAKGAQNDWIVTYDEVLVITKGVFSVVSEGTTTTAKAGEIIFLKKNTKLTYRADEDSELVYVSYPHWAEAQQASEHADLLDTFHPVDAA